MVDGPGARFAHEFVHETDVGKGASGHDGVVSSAGTVRVELARRQAVLCQVSKETLILINLYDRHTNSVYLAAGLVLPIDPAGLM